MLTQTLQWSDRLHRPWPHFPNPRFRLQSYAFDAARTHTDLVIASSSKVLQGYGKYVVIAVGERSFNGRVRSLQFFS